MLLLYVIVEMPGLSRYFLLENNIYYVSSLDSNIWSAYCLIK